MPSPQASECKYNESRSTEFPLHDVQLACSARSGSLVCTRLFESIVEKIKQTIISRLTGGRSMQSFTCDLLRENKLKRFMAQFDDKVS